MILLVIELTNIANVHESSILSSIIQKITQLFEYIARIRCSLGRQESQDVTFRLFGQMDWCQRIQSSNQIASIVDGTDISVLGAVR